MWELLCGAILLIGLAAADNSTSKQLNVTKEESNLSKRYILSIPQYNPVIYANSQVLPTQQVVFGNAQTLVDYIDSLRAPYGIPSYYVLPQNNFLQTYTAPNVVQPYQNIVPAIPHRIQQQILQKETAPQQVLRQQIIPQQILQQTKQVVPQVLRQQIVPQQIVTPQVLRQQVVPQQVLRQQVAPQQLLRQQIIPQQVLRQQIIPQQLLPQTEQVLRQQIVPQQIVTPQVLRQQVVPQQIISQQILRQQVVPQQLLRQQIIPQQREQAVPQFLRQRIVPPQVLRQQIVPQQILPQVLSQQPQPAAPQQLTPQQAQNRIPVISYPPIQNNILAPLVQQRIAPLPPGKVPLQYQYYQPQQRRTQAVVGNEPFPYELPPGQNKIPTTKHVPVYLKVPQIVNPVPRTENLIYNPAIPYNPVSYLQGQANSQPQSVYANPYLQATNGGQQVVRIGYGQSLLNEGEVLDDRQEVIRNNRPHIVYADPSLYTSENNQAVVRIGYGPHHLDHQHNDNSPQQIKLDLPFDYGENETSDYRYGENNRLTRALSFPGKDQIKKKEADSKM